ncbi:radical SAM protein [Alkalibaculum sp. M08DMB]|uniref:Radical SAM protein n=1 Tax=Alkalibaculum sporogenes TaxID=2655001 RepID=A0A6A7K4B0_9FIRM|nr:radical SAM protein [Alkalibaculum sporogenes]MPW24292.1 radical SAM protein [Alkalibaculum sporogenes]
MSNQFDLQDYVSNGIESVIRGIIKASLKNPKETAFVIKFALAIKEAQRKKKLNEENGHSIPAFLISSISSSCNLFCSGCYARATQSCGDGFSKEQMTNERWKEIFIEARELGISFILLAGGEPFMRKDVLQSAAQVKEIMFPIFTNGTMFEEEDIKLLDKNRNLVPILSIEGDKEQTDKRRGQGTYNIIMDSMDNLHSKGILYGISVTVTRDNIETITSEDYFELLYNKGCKALIYVEYVPLIEETKNSAPTDFERTILETELQKLRMKYEDAIFLSFPGDEKFSGGCLAAGRGFFHINVDGSAEPCPFSPFSDTNLKNCNLREALNSPLFNHLKESGMLLEEHDGGCVLFEKENEVKEIMNKTK